jgi:hypothetical protein
MNCASAIIGIMLATFLGSAKVLPRDAGLFKGPWPACCAVCGESSLLSALSQNQRIVVTCPDERAEQVEECVNNHSLVNLVLGIRAAKCLEFKDIILYDFFGGRVQAADHKAWEHLLSDELHEAGAYKYPQVESQLRLLYTAMTRSCNRLFFVEIQSNSLVSLFFRWLPQRDLADPFTPSVDGDMEFMTREEWRARGIDFALGEEGDSASLFHEKAVKCFSLSGDASLRSKAQLQLRALEMSAALRVRAQDSIWLRPQEEELELTSLSVSAIHEDLFLLLASCMICGMCLQIWYVSRSIFAAAYVEC